MIVVAQHRNQYNSRSRAHGAARYGSFVSPNCRGFESGAGLFQTQAKSCKKPVSKWVLSGSSSPKTQSCSSSTTATSFKSHSEGQKKSRRPIRSSEMVIPINLKMDFESRNVDSLNVDKFRFSELWAGPAYSNSPPPSSLPIPKFSLRPKRTVSLELPRSASDIGLQRVSRSAPASPTRERSPSPGATFDSIDSATQTLRRILNLEVTDE